MSTMIRINNVSKRYLLGEFGSKSIFKDLKEFFKKISYKVSSRSNTEEKKYTWALKSLNFELKKGEVLGIVGKNGAGKSTILKLLSKVTKPTTGSISINGKIASLLEVGTGFHEELTGRENIFLNGAILGMNKKEIKSKLNQIISFSGCNKYIDTPVKRYSSGMKVRLAFSVAAHLDPDILIVDEVLAVGDIEFQEKCLGKMKEVSGLGRTIIFVSHDMGAIKSLCDRCIVLNKGEIHYEGSTTDAINEYVKLNTSKNQNNGLINTKDYTYYDGKLNFNKINLLNYDNQNKTVFNYREKIKIKIHFQLNENIEDLIFSVSIISREGNPILYGTTIDQDYEKLHSLKIGKYNLEIETKFSLLPGNYYVTLGATNKNGVSYSLVERALDFKINRTGTEKNNSYRWVNSNGYAIMEGNWKIL